MLNRSEEGQCQGGADPHVAESKRLGIWSRGRCLFFILILAAVLLFYNTDMKTIDPKWWNPFSPHASAPSTNDSSIGATEPTAAGIHFSSSALLQTAHTTSTQATENTTVPPILVPYTSPGLYLVEYPYDYHFIINEPHKCEEQKPFVVLMVPVAPSNRLHRDIVRNSWGGEPLILGKVVKLFFVVGRHSGDGAEAVQELLLQESKEHQDVIQSDFTDCYKNLTIKTMVMLEWLDSYCSSASYAMKVDSDTFLNGHNLVNMLLTAPKENYMTGLVAIKAEVRRDPASKWYVPMDLYPHWHYPHYALGVGYVLSLDLPKKLVAASKHVKALYIEDVYLGLCMEYLGIPCTDPPKWGYFNVFPVPYSRCAYSRIIVTTTKANTDRMETWKDFQRPGPYC